MPGKTATFLYRDCLIIKTPFLFLYQAKLIDNILVPKHEVMPPEEAEKILLKYSVTRDELPKIKITDPALSKLEVGGGEIIKITRTTPLIGESYYYRVVVER